MGALKLTDSIDVLKGVGLKRLEQFKKLKIKTIEDLVFFAPRDYLDYSQITNIEDLVPGKVTIKAHLANPVRSWRKGRLQITQAVFEDETGQVKATWFNQSYRKRQLMIGHTYMISGEYEFAAGSYGFTMPSVERVESERLSTGVVVAKYPETKGLNSRTIRATQKEALDNLDQAEDIYPDDFIADNQLTSLPVALKQLHFPGSEEEGGEAKARLSFDEVFAIQLANYLAKEKLKKEKAPVIKFDDEVAKQYVSDLKFKLTDTQKVTSWEILQDINADSPMNRMLEGEVGSGKTVVAAMAVRMAAHNNQLSVFLAPTTILAEQHYKTLKELLIPYKLKIALLTRHVSAKDAKQIKADLKAGKFDLVVGTHALLSEDVEYPDLSLVIVDEQHRFGVKQRAKLRDKKTKELPHVLTMTATPIPRSLALTLYGELDISIINQLPGGRKPIETAVLSWAARSHAYDHLVKELKAGNQAYIVAPRIEDTEDNMTSVKQLEKELAKSYLKDFKFSILHAKMKPDQKENIMEAFYKGDLGAVISTSVVEVGVDNPNATIMIIESAERFGLAQLHQLRGRVGRGSKQSTCYVISSKDSEPSRRLIAMSQTNDGFKLSELDLRIRGAGALYGTRQHGPLDINIADITDKQLLQKVAKAVDNFVEKGYDSSKFPLLSRRLAHASRATFLN